MNGRQHRGRRSLPRMSLLAITIVMFAGGPSAAQKATLRIESQQGYANQPLRIQVDVKGLDDKSQPEIKLVEPPDPALSVTPTGVAPQTSSSMTIINGRVTRDSSTRWLYSFEVIASETGQFQIGPFEVTQNGQTLTTSSVDIAFGEVAIDDNMQVEFEIADRDFFVGERATIQIRWSYTGQLDRLGDVAVRVPAFDRFECTPLLEQNQQRTLRVVTRQGTIKMPVTVQTRRAFDRETVVFEARGEMLLNQAGEFELEPVSATAQYVTQWSRDPFGEIFPGFGTMGPRRAAAAKPIRAVGQPLQLTVRPLPTQGRPASFAGAVGEQFGIQVEANRTVVRVDDPISLTVTLIGDRSLETASLPDLTADGGMSPDLFRLPEESPSGVFRDGRRQFEVTVRVKDESVTEIPAVAYSWFDPVTKDYQTARSSPIALRVLPAQVVSADDVVSAHAAPSPEAETDEPPASAAVVSNLDLAIEENVSRLTRPQPRRLPLTTTLPYAAGAAALLWAFVDRRRSQQAATGGRTRRELQAQLRMIDTARGLPSAEAAVQVASALRTLLPHAPIRQRESADQLIGQLETVVYAPQASADGLLDEQLLSQAHQAAVEIIEAKTT